MTIEDYRTVNETAAELRLSVGRVRQLCISGRLRGEKFGRDWLIKAEEVKRFRALDRRPGRPVEKN